MCVWGGGGGEHLPSLPGASYGSAVGIITLRGIATNIAKYNQEGLKMAETNQKQYIFNKSKKNDNLVSIQYHVCFHVPIYKRCLHCHLMLAEEQINLVGQTPLQ